MAVSGPSVPPLAISVQKLDELASQVLGSKVSGPVTTAIAAFKIVIFLAYLWARKRLIDEASSEEALRKARQAYEQTNISTAKEEIASDDAFTKAHAKS